jgi:quinol monooxygenase YgiN
MYCVTARFEVRPENADAFAARTQRQAADSLTREPGCHLFDVWMSASKPNSVYLYEIYTDRQAFDDHLKSEHFIAFDKDVAAWVISKTVETWERKL